MGYLVFLLVIFALIISLIGGLILWLLHVAFWIGLPALIIYFIWKAVTDK